MASSITVAAPPNTSEVAQELLAAMAAQSGVVTDYNKGSQIRTFAEAIGSVAEISGVSALAIALQVIAYGGMSIFGISPNTAVPSSGAALFATAFLSNAPTLPNDVAIPSGTLLQTLSGIQFQTTQAATLVAGATGVTVPVSSLTGGLNTNVPAGAISQVLTAVVAPLIVINPAATSGGLDAETPTQALSRLASKFVSLIGGSPISVANSAIGVNASGSSETVRYTCCYEGWADPSSPNFPLTAGFNVYIDNGSGSASQALLAAVTTKLNGNFNTQTPAYRPSGVPFTVLAIGASGGFGGAPSSAPGGPVYADVAISGTLGPLAIQAQVTDAIAVAVSGYFTLPFGTSAQQPTLAAVVSNAALGQISSLSVNLYYSSNPGTSVPAVSGALFTRVLLKNLTINVPPG